MDADIRIGIGLLTSREAKWIRITSNIYYGRQYLCETAVCDKYSITTKEELQCGNAGDFIFGIFDKEKTIR